MPYKEKNITKKYFLIHEVAEMFNVATSCLRHWEEKFSDYICVSNHKVYSNREDRRYTKKDILRIYVIWHHLKINLFTIKGARIAIGLDPAPESNVNLTKLFK